MDPYGKISIARVIHSSQRCCLSCVRGDVAFASTPGSSRRPHRMLNLPSEILVEQME